MRLIELSIIIVNYHSADYVLSCIRSINEQTSAVAYEVIVVDNASFDGCGERLAREFPSVIFLQSLYNLGFARANNLGAGHANGGTYLFLNPDTEVLDGAVDRLYARFGVLKDAGAVGCRLFNTDGSLQTSCVQSLPTILNQMLDAEILRLWFPLQSLWGTRALLQGRTDGVEVEAVSGACLMIRRAVFEQLGGFSSDYFMYGEDLDLCFKARLAGLHNYHVGEAEIIHHGGGSTQQERSNFSIVMMRESVKRLLRKFRGRSYSIGYRLALSGAAALRLTLMTMAIPVFLDSAHRQVGTLALRKWLAILRWGIGLERWTENYEQLGAVPARSKGCEEF